MGMTSAAVETFEENKCISDTFSAWKNQNLQAGIVSLLRRFSGAAYQNLLDGWQPKGLQPVLQVVLDQRDLWSHLH